MLTFLAFRKTRARARRSLHIVALVALGGCGADSITSVPAGELDAAPLTITVDGQALVLEPELWRDFQPLSPPNGKPLVAFLRVRALDGSPVTASFHLDALWAVNGSETWAVAVTEERLPAPGVPFFEAVARDGPKWTPGARVDVVVRIRLPSGATHLLRAEDKLIQRSD